MTLWLVILTMTQFTCIILIIRLYYDNARIRSKQPTRAKYDGVVEDENPIREDENSYGKKKVIQRVKDAERCVYRKNGVITVNNLYPDSCLFWDWEGTVYHLRKDWINKEATDTLHTVRRGTEDIPPATPCVVIIYCKMVEVRDGKARLCIVDPYAKMWTEFFDISKFGLTYEVVNNLSGKILLLTGTVKFTQNTDTDNKFFLERIRSTKYPLKLPEYKLNL